MGIYYEWSASCSSRHCRPQEVLVPSRARTSATESSNSSRATSPSISNHVQLSKLECTKHLLIRQPAIAPILTPFAVSSGPNNVSGADIHLRIPSYFTDQSTFFMSHTLATLSSHESTLSFSKKRSTEAAFPQSSSADDTPPNSRPPSRAHMQKRPRFRNTTERPKYVTRKEESIPLQHSVGVSVNVLWPGSVEMETGTLGEVLEGYSGRMQNGTSGLNGMYGGGGAMRGRFIVLCFLGVTVEHLRQLSQVSSLLTSFNAHIFGVSLSAPPPDSSPLPIIHDYTRSLTLHLGLMHPLGGGRQALDAIVVLDSEARRRMALPLGCGQQPPVPMPVSVMRGRVRDGDGENGSGGVQSVVGNCVKGVEWLAGEREEELQRELEVAGEMGTTGEMDVEMGIGGL